MNYKGSIHHNWKGDNINYHGIHAWLKREFGKANKCENKACKYGNPKRFEWALIKGKTYKRRISHFIQLCKSCHLKYDGIIILATQSKFKAVSATKNRITVKFDSIKKATNTTGVSGTSISNNLKGRSNSSGGYQWKYV